MSWPSSLVMLKMVRQPLTLVHKWNRPVGLSDNSVYSIVYWWYSDKVYILIPVFFSSLLFLLFIAPVAPNCIVYRCCLFMCFMYVAAVYKIQKLFLFTPIEIHCLLFIGSSAHSKNFILLVRVWLTSSFIWAGAPFCHLVFSGFRKSKFKIKTKFLFISFFWINIWTLFKHCSFYSVVRDSWCRTFIIYIYTV